MCNAKHGYTLAVGIDEAKRGPNKEANNSTRKKVIVEIPINMKRIIEKENNRRHFEQSRAVSEFVL